MLGWGVLCGRVGGDGTCVKVSKGGGLFGKRTFQDEDFVDEDE